MARGACARHGKPGLRTAHALADDALRALQVGGKLRVGDLVDEPRAQQLQLGHGYVASKMRHDIDGGGDVSDALEVVGIQDDGARASERRAADSTLPRRRASTSRFLAIVNNHATGIVGSGVQPLITAANAWAKASAMRSAAVSGSRVRLATYARSAAR